MHSGQFTIKLTPEESELADSIEFNALLLRDNVKTEANGELVYKLTNSLLKRAAIPEQRLRYFIDPEYNSSGAKKSRKTAFIQNSGSEEKMIHHPHFLKYLSYFIHGANLPPKIMTTFNDAVVDCGQVTSGDIATLTALAKQLVRSHKIDPASSADEFYKLSLDLNLSHHDAASIRSSVKQIRTQT